MDNRNYPDITFVNSDTATIEAELTAAYEKQAGRTLYPADPVKILLMWAAAILSQERALMNDIAKQNMPRYARGNNLDSLCEIFKDVQRLEARPATVTLEFTISEAQAASVVIPSGTRVSVDGNITFATDSDVVIEAGALTTVCSATCIIPGAIGNGFEPGQITQCVDVFPYYQSVTNITASGGGSDEEDDASLYQRMRESMAIYSTAGPSDSYVYHAKSASSLIADVRPTSPSPGKVDVRILCEGGVFPDEELINTVLAALSDGKVRPLTDNVTVSAPTAVSFDIDVTYYVANGSGLSLTEADAAVAAAVDEYIAWQTAAIGRDINPTELIYLIRQAGVKRVVVNAPVYTVLGETEAAQLGTSVLNNGGYEDE